MFKEFINWDRPKLELFKAEYEKHSGDKDNTFRFEKKLFVVGYAKYLIEYLEGVLGE